MKDNKERFFVINQDLEFRVQVDEATGKRSVIGYGALYNSPSREMVFERNGQFRKFIERIEPGAFDNCQFNECTFNLEHDSNRVIGRIGKNLVSQPNSRGLFFTLSFETEERSTTEQNDFVKNVSQGLINQCSFRAHVAKDEFIVENGVDIRSIKQFDYCIDICGTVMGAYPETWLVKRTFDESVILPTTEPPATEEAKEETPEPNEIEVMDMDIDILGLS